MATFGQLHHRGSKTGKFATMRSKGKYLTTKGLRKNTRKNMRKNSRKNTRKGSRKGSRKASRKNMRNRH